MRTPQDLALLEYCSTKLYQRIQEMKLGSARRKAADGSANRAGENGITVQIHIKKGEPSYSSHSYYYSSSSASTLSTWKNIGEYPIVARLSSALTVDGLREMLGKRLSYALKLNDVDHSRMSHENAAANPANNAPAANSNAPAANSMAAASQEMSLHTTLTKNTTSHYSSRIVISVDTPTHMRLLIIPAT